MNNQIYGYRSLPEDNPEGNIEFEGASSILPTTDTKPVSPKIRFFTAPHTNLQSCYSDKYKAYSYVWGIPAHPDISPPDIPEWCAKNIAEKDYDRFKELIGTFVIIIDEPEQDRITFVTDILGIRPIFLGNHEGRIVFGSRVWPVYRAGLSSGSVDYDSVCAWISYGFNCTDGTFFSDLRRPSPGSVITLQDNKYSEIQYTKFTSASNAPEIEQVSEDIHKLVSASMKVLMNSNDNQILLPLSGGFDSRYLLALLRTHEQTSFRCATVRFTNQEGRVAGQVADIMDVPLEKFDVEGSIWNLYDDVYHFMADGFPITKCVTYRIAQEYPGIPQLNGFMGDVLIRGDSDRYKGKLDSEWKENLVDVLQQKHTKISSRLFRKETANKIRMRSRPPMERAVKEGNQLGRIFNWQDYYYTHRFYISNNFLQNIGFSETILPFYNWSLLEYKMKHDYSVFNLDTYRGIFERYFPELAAMPRSSDSEPKNLNPYRGAKCTKQWSMELFPKFFDNKQLSVLLKRLCVPLDMAGIAGINRVEFAIFAFKRLYMLEEKARDNGVNFDWDCI